MFWLFWQIIGVIIGFAILHVIVALVWATFKLAWLSSKFMLLDFIPRFVRKYWPFLAALALCPFFATMIDAFFPGRAYGGITAVLIFCFGIGFCWWWIRIHHECNVPGCRGDHRAHA